MFSSQKLEKKPVKSLNVHNGVKNLTMLVVWYRAFLFRSYQIAVS